MRRAGAPAGIPLGRALDVPAGIAYDELREVVAAIDRVHGDGELSRIPVRLVAGVGDFGRFRFDDVSGEAISIAIRSNQTHRQLAVLHEIGHFLDWRALGDGSNFGSSANPVMRGWVRAVSESTAFQRLNELVRRGAAVVESSGGTSRPVPFTIDEIVALRGLVQAEEFWARSYAQYVAQQMRHPRLSQSLTALRTRRPDGVYYPIQWDDEDFVPIAEAINDLFHDLGWRR